MKKKEKEVAEMKRKINPDYEGFGKHPERLLAELSNPLFTALAKSNLTLPSLRLADFYVARINPKEPTKRLVRIHDEDIKKILDVKQIKKNDLEKKLNALISAIRIADPDDENNFHSIAFMTEAMGWKDEYGRWTVDLKCSEEAMKYLFNDFMKYGYIRHLFHAVVSLSSRYSHVLFLYLEQHRKMHQWDVDLQSLKDLLGCGDVENYNYANFNDKVLKRAKAEIEGKTNTRFEYAPLKMGRTVVAIHFEVKHLADIEEKLSDTHEGQEQIEGQKTLFDEETVEILENPLKDAFDGKFKDEELEAIQSTLDLRMPKEDDKQKIAFARYCYAQYLRNSKQRTISNPFAYINKLLTTAEIPTVTETKRPGTETKGEYRDNKYIPSNNYDYDAILEEHRRRLYEQYDDKKE